MPKPESFPIEKIFVPTKQKKALKPETVGEIAESMLEIGQQTPISVRRDGDRLVLVKGLHRLEACKALGETTILGVLVTAEPAQHKPLLAERPEVEAERLKMARLKQLRLEKEAAEAATSALKDVRQAEAPRTRSTQGARGNPKAAPGRAAKPPPKSLSDWITQQKGSGGRY
ncbi:MULTISPECIES: ParB N-terminal domain-containing protein [unclassified Bradyrhizobium]|uniref:ParB N-terminal domain-containing protein n=1 Tax=unclassified Bradyrhizobium TaxID=2631580 RepID=UPI00211E8CD2|nr:MULTISPECIES: ParB N-terminal domain-containing protein [unclassified Bradyrhizobium]MDD1535909.1 chromosome partitioning protein ParB [Bradyrhizobium sp. WBOS8]MDD1585416.1 chromosome partitioning protein ParB [Bradyrhizobium sp. WBOS4]UUO48671.1 chromosome partitioning protein ParB [Bradyrhizobium sp. WBOS04]UUO62491.1 chromosome partitioning protein ParB [Bradyrhizobium sp. WBOS08]